MSDKESHVTKSDLTISGGGKLTIYPQIAKYDLPQIVCTIYPPLKSPGKIYPSNRQVRFTPLKSSNFEQNFKRTQHHALLHKGLFCERAIIPPCPFQSANWIDHLIRLFSFSENA